jgi:hypothetical protein
LIVSTTAGSFGDRLWVGMPGFIQLQSGQQLRAGGAPLRVLSDNLFSLLHPRTILVKRLITR